MKSGLAIGRSTNRSIKRVSETEEHLKKLEGELARPRKVFVRKLTNRKPIHGARNQLFKKLAAEDTMEYYFKY